MKKNKNTMIVSVIMWIPLAIVVYLNSKDDDMFQRILMSIASFPIAAFEAGIIALFGALLLFGSFAFLRNFEVFKVKEGEDTKEIINNFLTGIYGIALAVLYYLTITNKHIFLNLYGGWK